MGSSPVACNLWLYWKSKKTRVSHFHWKITLEKLQGWGQIDTLPLTGVHGWPHRPRTKVSIWRNTFHVYLWTNYEFQAFYFPGEISMTLWTCYFWYIGHAWQRTPKDIKSICRILMCLSTDKKSTSSSTIF